MGVVTSQYLCSSLDEPGCFCNTQPQDLEPKAHLVFVLYMTEGQLWILHHIYISLHPWLAEQPPPGNVTLAKPMGKKIRQNKHCIAAQSSYLTVAEENHMTALNSQEAGRLASLEGESWAGAE